MQKQISKYLFPVFLSGILLVLLALAQYFRMGLPGDAVFFQVSLGDEKRQICLFDDRDYTLYAFLPAQAEMDCVTIHTRNGVEAWLEGQQISAGMSMENMMTNTPYTLRVRSGLRMLRYQLIVLHSENTASLFVDTRSGKMDRIHSKKSNREDVTVALYDASGLVYCSEDYAASLKGHGNTTWGRDKKPYELSLSDPADLLGSGAASNWILLANYLDETHLRGDLIYQLARETTDCWTTNCQHVDLYLNGEYAGLYQLTDRVEVANNRLELADFQVLLNLEITDRAGAVAVTDLFPGISAEVRWPSNLSEADRFRLDEELRRAFDGLTSHSFSDKALAETFDLDSWAWLYLLQEVSSNYDAGVASLYFYTADGVIFAGPAWDYDNALGSWAHYSPTNCFAAQSVRTPLWRAFLMYEPFRSCVTRQYRETFEPKLAELLSGELDARRERVAVSKEWNYLRWHPLEYKQGKFNSEDDPADTFLFQFLERRKTLLDDIWLREIPVCQVRIDHAGSVDGVYGYYVVASGTTLAQLAEIEKFNAEALEYAESGERAELFRPITEDVVLRMRPSEPEGDGSTIPDSVSAWIHLMKSYPDETVSIFDTAVIIMVLAAMLAIELQRRR